MVEVFSQEILIYGFALFFVFVVLIIMIVRYSNRQLFAKISDVKKSMAEEIAKLDSEMRHLVLANARERKELLEELEKLKGKEHLHHENHARHAEEKKSNKLKAVARHKS